VALLLVVTRRGDTTPGGAGATVSGTVACSTPPPPPTSATDSVCHRLTSHGARTAFLRCGDPTGHGFGDPGYELPLEDVPVSGHFVRGMGGHGSRGRRQRTAGEFFLVHRDFTVEPGAPRYTVVGRVVDGQRLVDHIATRGGEDTRPDGPPFTSISILRVTVERE
jgi:peptidyl-prolyl cis-trans isomerase B (cyclophilin B)